MDDQVTIEPDRDAAETLEGTSVLQRAQKRRLARDLGGGWHDLPSWGGEMQCYYQVLQKEDVEDMIRRARARAATKKGQKGNAAGVKVDAGANDSDLDFIIKAGVRFKAIDMGTLEEQMLELTYRDVDSWKQMLHNPNPEDADEEEAQRLLEAVTHPREMVAYLMGNNSIAIASHAGMLANWMQDTSKEVPQ
jgi:hypothetical protein